MDDQPPATPDEEFVIDDPEVLKVIADSRRLQILRALRRPKTVKEIAGQLERPQSQLYYHVNQLEKHGLVRVVETNVVSGIIEKVYQVAARHFRVADGLFAGEQPVDEHLEAVLSAIFDETKEEIKRSVKAGLMKVGNEEAEEHKDIVWQAHFHLTAAQRDALFQKLTRLVDETEEATGADEDDVLPEYGLILAFYPVQRGPIAGE